MSLSVSAPMISLTEWGVPVPDLRTPGFATIVMSIVRNLSAGDE